MSNSSRSKALHDDYEGFVDKFKPKLTTDDCYTPPEVYDVVAGWVAAEYGLDRSGFVRPFWPGGDYEAFDYPEGCTVVDNPPFSILSKIVRFYLDSGIRFFLFCPSLTAMSGRRNFGEVCAVIRATVAGLYGEEAASHLVVQYGGSMNAGNAAELLAQPDVDGGLIGGASLKADAFSQIVEAASK